MQLSMATDYASDTGNAEPFLRGIAHAGFRHIQWIHHWRHDFIYTRPEVEYISELMDELGLSLYDIHAPTGNEKNWFSTVEYQRRAGVEIIKNRIEMCQTLGGQVIVTHIPELISENLESWYQLKKSLDELEEVCAQNRVRIAVENRSRDQFDGIAELFSEYSPQYLGLCYDTGHGNIGGKGLGHLDNYKERLISLHLHDNKGSRDKHQPVFSGTVDWDRFARIIAASPYREFLTFETDIRHSGFDAEAAFLESTYAGGLELLALIERYIAV